MKSVLISIRPEWCGVIASGRKTMEVRKTRPKMQTPFKCYIYCTSQGSKIFIGGDNANGKVIGEFICDDIAKFESEFYEDDSVLNAVWSPEIEENVLYKIWGNDDDRIPRIGKRMAMTLDELKNYIGTDKPYKEFYGWYISDLIIYDKPKEVREFRKNCPNKAEYCSHCGWKRTCDNQCANPKLLISRPPQSWCYVEEVSE